MKIGCIGNMNNNFFGLIRYLQDKGYDAELCLLNYEPDHFHPSCDTYDLDYRRYTRKLEWGTLATFGKTREMVRRDLGRYDFIIATGTVPAFAWDAGVHIDCMQNHGSDIFEVPFFNPVLSRDFFSRYRFAKSQKLGWRDADYTFVGTGGFHLDILQDKIKFQGEPVFLNFPFIYEKTYNPDVMDSRRNQCCWAGEFDAVREKHDIMIVHPTRQWEKCKGNMTLFKGLKKFVDANPGKSVGLVCLEYGPDVDAAKRLVHELELDDNVYWFPKMYRRELMYGMHVSDIVSGSFAISFLTYGVQTEAFSLGKPFLAWADLDQHRDYCPELYEFMNAKTPDQVCERLNEYVEDPQRFIDMGRDGMRWNHKYFVEKPLAVLDEILAERGLI